MVVETGWMRSIVDGAYAGIVAPSGPVSLKQVIVTAKLKDILKLTVYAAWHATEDTVAQITAYPIDTEEEAEYVFSIGFGQRGMMYRLKLESEKPFDLSRFELFTLQAKTTKSIRRI